MPTDVPCKARPLGEAERLADRTVEADLVCVECGYSLRGLSGETIVCPECGCATKSLGKEECEVGP